MKDRVVIFIILLIFLSFLVFPLKEQSVSADCGGYDVIDNDNGVIGNTTYNEYQGNWVREVSSYSFRDDHRYLSYNDTSKDYYYKWKFPNPCSYTSDFYIYIYNTKFVNPSAQYIVARSSSWYVVNVDQRNAPAGWSKRASNVGPNIVYIELQSSNSTLGLGADAIKLEYR